MLRRGGGGVTGVRIERATSQDRAEIEALLAANHLPIAGVKQWLGSALVARAGSRTIGCAALEVFSSGVLLRSVAVESAWRGRGVGRQLTDAGLDLARSRGADAAYLLTTTAGDFFPRFGFERVEREDVPDDVKQSIEFTAACPSSALVMRARL
jgi:amino-acid N-acetyltransferase